MGVWPTQDFVGATHSCGKKQSTYSCIILFILFLPFHSSSTNLYKYHHKGITNSELGECSVTAVSTYLADFDKKLHLGDEISRINALVDTFLDSSTAHCFTMLTVIGGKEAFDSGGIDSRVQLLELSLPVHLRNVHFFLSRWQLISDFLASFAKTNVIFLDTDILALYRDTSYIFESTSSWELAFAISSYAEEYKRVNCGVMLVRKNGYDSMIELSQYILRKGLSVLKKPKSMISDGLGRKIFNDQILVLEFMNKFGNFPVAKATNIKYNSGGIHMNPCLHIKYGYNSTLRPFNILLLNRYEWNGNPVRLLPFTKFSHYKGRRKKYMLYHYAKLRKLKTDFVSFRGIPDTGFWCTRGSRDPRCSFRPVTFKQKCI